MDELQNNISELNKKTLVQNLPHAEEKSRYKLTFIFVGFYYLISHGRLHLIVPMLASIPCAMIAGCLAVIAFWIESDKQQGNYCLNREEKLVIGLVVMCVVSLPTSTWLGNSITTLYKYFLPTAILMFITGIICKTIADIYKFIWLYVFNSMSIIGVSLSSGISHYSEKVSDAYDVNDIAMIIGCAIPIMFFFALQHRGVKRLILIICCLFAVITVAHTGSRGGVLGLIAFGGYLVTQTQRKVKSLLLILTVSVLFLVSSPDSTKVRVASMLNPQTEYDQTLGARTQIWKNGVKLFFDSPFVGVGVGNYIVADGSSKETGSWRTAHNSFLQIAVELGGVGLFLFLNLTIGTFLSLRRLRGELQTIDSTPDVIWALRGAEASLIVFVVSSFFLSQAYNAQFYFIVALAIAAQKIILSRGTTF